MTCRIPASFFRGLIPLAAMLATTPAGAQFNRAYDEGYKPMLGLAGSLKELAEVDAKRFDFGAVRDVGANYVEKLERMIAALDNAGKNFKDGDNKTWMSAAISPVNVAAKAARDKAVSLRKKGEDKQDCRGDAINLQRALTDLSDEFQKCWKAHEARRQDLIDRYVSARERWWNMTKDDRKPLDDLAKKAASLREKRNELQSKAEAAGRLYLTAQDQCDKARAELFNTEKERSPDEVRQRYENWKKAEDLVKRIAEALASADRDAADAVKSHNEAEAEFQKATEAYMKKAVESDQMYFVVMGYHVKMFDITQEYKPFSW